MSKSMATNDISPVAKQTQLPDYGGRASPRGISIRRISSALKSYVSGVVARRALRRLEYDLLRMDNRMLKDIGLDRSEICRVVHYGREF